MAVKFERPDGFISGLPNCGIVAIAIVSGFHYEQVAFWFQQAQKISRPRAWKGWTKAHHYEPAMRAFKVRFYWAKPAGKDRSLGWFSGWHTIAGKTYLVRIPGHVLVLRDGMILDNRGPGPRPVADDPMARRKVTHAWRILEEGER